MNPAHRALREATRAAHDRVDAVFAGFDLSDRESYAAFLGAHADALLPIEHALDGAGAEQLIADWPERKRGHLIKEDLALLRHPGERRDLRRPGAPARDPGFRRDDEWLAGTLYVIEGSRLGGKFLARSLPPRFPRAYLDADQPSGNWRKLLDRLDAILYQPIATASRSTSSARSSRSDSSSRCRPTGWSSAPRPISKRSSG